MHRPAALLAAWGLVALAAGCAAAPGAHPPPAAPAIGSTPVSQTAARPSFKDFVAGLKAEARSRGIRPAVIEEAFKGVTRNTDVVDLNERQPEFTRQIWEYLDGAVSADRIKNGEANMRRYAGTLGRAEAAYGVPREVVVAIWGLESSYGRIMGDFDVIEALTTLAYAGPRAGYGREQLFAALEILNRGDVPRSHLTGSWAGAMGHTQFVPTSYLRFAVDGDGDARRNLIDSLADALHSTANYLAENGWRTGERWGLEVELPAGFDYGVTEVTVTRPVSEWQRLGVRRTGGAALAGPGVPGAALASVIVPGGHKGPAFLVLPNFSVILRYNNATAYALAIGHLSDRIKGGSPIDGDWPRDERALSRAERLELQRLLAAKGFEVGEPDGVIGRQTRAAIRAFQTSVGLVPDGFASIGLLVRLRRAAG